MRTDDLAVATMTLARTEQEAALLSRALELLTAHGWPTIVADGASVPSFREFLRSHRTLRMVEPEGPGLVGQVRRAMDEAARQHGRFVLYTEPDKATFFQQHLAGFLAAAPDDDDVGVVLACRTPPAFETFPQTQRTTEEAINRLCGHVLGADGDYSYGPFLLNRRLAPLVRHAEAELGWGWRHFVFGAVARLRWRIVHVTGHFACPEEQRAEHADERLHRLKQLQQNVAGLLLSHHERMADAISRCADPADRCADDSIS
ncbi:MAG: hypothetical protein IT184_08925 [Acidobacteria bacterium]|nr:hypothetical protein [Acidobacteriota bacterium]